MTMAAHPSQRGRTGWRTVAIPAARNNTANPPTIPKNDLVSNTLSVCAEAAN